MKAKDIDRFIGYTATPFEDALSAAYGRAVRLLAGASKKREDSLKSAGARLWPAVRLNQIEFLYDSHGTALAFASWAFLTEEIAQTLAGDPTYKLDISEWNEGDQLWVVDFFAPYGAARILYRKLRLLHFPHAARVRAIRTYLDGKPERLVDLRLRPNEL